MRDNNAVVCHRLAAIGRASRSVLHLALGQHTAAAMYYHRVGAEVFGKISARGKLKGKLLARVFAYPFGKLLRAYISALAVMRASLGHEYLITVREAVKHCRASHRVAKVALVTREKYRKRGKLNISRHDLRHLAEYLRVGYYHSRLLTKL